MPLPLRLTATYQRYPRQFWLMIAGMLLSSTGGSMIWPFLTIYVSQRTGMPMTAIASLLTINSISAVGASFLAGPVIDRFGRKWMMIAGLSLNGLVYIFLGQAQTLPVFAVLMAMFGVVNPVYRVAADAMLADLVPVEKRIDAYSLMRLSANLGIAIGPAIGGFIAGASYNLAFYLAAIGMVSYSLLLLLAARETMPQRQPGTDRPREAFGGYQAILNDRRFLAFLGLVTFGIMPGNLIWVLMPVYANQNFGVPEPQYGLIATTNALMVVMLQVLVTGYAKHYPPVRIMALGAMFYGLGAGSVFFATGFWGFWLAMVIATCGELVLVPTSSTFTANLAPPDKRGRYMSLYGLTWPVASGIGPLIGGVLNDTFSPRYIWLGGLIFGLFSLAGFIWLARRRNG